MNPTPFSSGLAILGLLLAAAPAAAIPRTFVSGTGSGASCTRAAPCATFQAAHNVTDALGEINCVDAGEFGTLIITKSITIDCTGTGGSISATSTDAVTINTPGIIVRLRNIAFDEPNSSGFVGISFTDGAALHVESCTFSSFGNAILFLPNSGAGRLFLTDSVVTNSFGSNIVIGPGTSSGSARALVDGTRTVGSGTNGLRVTGAFGPAPAIVQVRNSVATQNGADGIRVDTAGSAVLSVTADRTSSTLNGGNGIAAVGSNTFILLGRSTAMSNGTGVAPTSGGAIYSYQDNRLTGNATDGAPTSVLTLK